MNARRRVRIQYYAVLREERGSAHEEFETTAASLVELYEELAQIHGFSLPPDRLKVVVNEEFVEWDQPLREGDTVVFIPPVAGG